MKACTLIFYLITKNQAVETQFQNRVKRYTGIWCCVEFREIGHIYYDMYWDDKPGWKPHPPQNREEDHPPWAWILRSDNRSTMKRDDILWWRQDRSRITAGSFLTPEQAAPIRWKKIAYSRKHLTSSFVGLFCRLIHFCSGCPLTCTCYHICPEKFCWYSVRQHFR